MTKAAGIGQRWAAYNPSKGTLGWACVASVVGTMVVGFTWGGWTTGGNASDMASTAADASRSELVAALCVDRFEAAADADTQLQALRDTQGWNRREFMHKGGWTTVPGKARPNDRGATLCADELLTRSAAPKEVSVAQ
jgi:hypothetical protein